MHKAIFFDRDGVINKNDSNYYTFRFEDFVLNDGIIEALKYFSELGFLLFVITNQGGIAKGIYTREDIEYLHNQIDKTYFQNVNIKISEYAVCPHHSQTGLCLCRKPASLLLEKLIAKYKIDIHLSLLIGDSGRDIEAAQKIGMGACLLESNKNVYRQLVEKGIITLNS